MDEKIAKMVADGDIQALIDKYLRINSEIRSMLSTMSEEEKEAMRDVIENHIAETKVGLDLLTAMAHSREVS